MSDTDSVLEFNDELIKQVAQAQSNQRQYQKRGFIIAAIIFAIGIAATYGASRSPYIERENSSSDSPKSLRQ